MDSILGPSPALAQCESPPIDPLAWRMQLLTSEREVLIRPLGENGAFELVLGLNRCLSLKTLRRLASHTDLAGLIERALATAV